MIFLIFIIYLVFTDFGLGLDLFLGSDIVDFISLSIIIYIVYSISYNISYNTYHEEFIEWALTFTIMSKLKYHHLLYLRNIHHRMHYFHKFGKIFIAFCIAEFSKTLKILPTLVDWYLVFDLDYTYDGLKLLIEEYNEEYKHLVLGRLFLSFIDL